MAFPSVRSEAESNQGTTFSTSHPITIGATVEKNDILVAVIGMSTDQATTATFTWPAGWTELLEVINDESNGVALSAAWKIADGSEDSGTVTVTTNVDERSVHKCWVVRDGLAVYAASAHSSGAAEVNGNPPSLSPAPGTKDYLWLTCALADANRDFSVYPTGYSSTGYRKSSAGTWEGFDYDSTLAWARKTARASSDDPSVFTWDSADQWIAITLAVSPVEIPAGVLVRKRPRTPHVAM